MQQQPKWTEDAIPAQNDKIYLITGANSGIGYHAARALLQKGAQVILACRNMEKANAAAESIRQLAPHSNPIVMYLDLADLASVRRFAGQIHQKFPRIDVLVNNAGVMALPARQQTADGFEMQFGINHLGHFALTGLLMDVLTATPAARVVTVSSMVHYQGRIILEDLQAEQSYSPYKAYSQSKLANLLFTLQLKKELASRNLDVKALAAHPGWSATNLQSHSRLASFFNHILAQPAKIGALPTLYAATVPDLESGDYIGPGGWKEMRGYPRKVSCSPQAQDEHIAARLWQVSQDLTGVTYFAE